MNLDRRVLVELGDSWGRHFVSRLADVGRSEEELRGQVGELNWRGIVKRQALDACQGDILGDLDTKTLETDDEDVGRAHALHGLVAQDIELAAVEGLVDLGGADDGIVDLHPGREVDLGELLVML